MAIRYPPPLQPGDRIGVTSPSSGVAPNHQPFPCAQTPSLTAAVLSQEGKVQSSVMIRGPLDFTVDPDAAARTDTKVGGCPARLIVLADPKGSGEQIWLWQVDGKTWYMKSYGFDDRGNRAIADAVRITGDTVVLDPSVAPSDLQVISQRNGTGIRTPDHPGVAGHPRPWRDD